VPHDHGAAVRFRASFDGAVGDLSPGDAVKLRGFPVGEVEGTEFHYDVSTGVLATPVTFRLYPRLFHVDGGRDGERFDDTVARLVDAGLRAQLERDPPVVGSERVALDMVSGAPAATLEVVQAVPQIPTAPAGGLESVAERVKDVPIHQIGQNVLDITKHVDEITSSPALKDSVAQLHASLRDVRRMVADVSPQVDRVVHELQDTAAHLRQTARTADRTLGGATSQTGVADTVREVKEAARSIRSLADYLDRHPEALISGRSGG
jgi:paraquat-inducible protein B